MRDGLELLDAPSEVAMSAIYRTDSPLGPAGRWFMGRLKQEVAQQRKENASPDRPPEFGRQRQAILQSSLAQNPAGQKVQKVKRAPIVGARLLLEKYGTPGP